MLSIELAMRLKEAGYSAEFLDDNFHPWCATCTKEVCGVRHFMGGSTGCDKYEGEVPFDTWPSLSQLLEEVEKRGYNCVLAADVTTFSYRCKLMRPSLESASVEVLERADTPEDAAALALLEIMKGEKAHEGN